jgi:hypothetical protein
MNSNDSLSSRILSDARLIAEIYNIVKNAGTNTVKNELVVSSNHNVNIIKPGIYGVNRASTNCRSPIANNIANNKACRHSSEYSIEYNPSDIIIVGGAALNIYDYLLRDLKERRGIKTLENYLKKKTSDIDIIWWPRPSTNKEIIVSSSKAIENLVYIFKEELVKNFAAKKDELHIKLKPYIKDITLDINVKSFHTWKAGVWSINIEFIVGKKILKICDISVHDSGSSQLYNLEGYTINDLRFMTEDPIYCDPRQGLNNSISYLIINDIYVAVPVIQSFIQQQMFAFDNLLRNNQEKAFIHYKRVEFIKNILQNIIITNLNNRNYTELIEIFKTNNLEFIKSTINYINNIEKNSINKNRRKILEFCSHITDDVFIKQLCYRASIDEDAIAHKYLSQIILQIDIIIKRIYNKIYSIPDTQFKQKYNNLLLYIESIKKSLLKMSSLELIDSRKTKLLEHITEEEGKIDSIINNFYNSIAIQKQKIINGTPMYYKDAIEYKSDPRVQIIHHLDKNSLPSNSVSSKSVSSNSVPSNSVPSNSVPSNSVSSNSVASKSVASKSVASKSVLYTGPFMPIITKDPKTGLFWYTDPYTMSHIIQDPKTGIWKETSSLFPVKLASAPKVEIRNKII